MDRPGRWRPAAGQGTGAPLADQTDPLLFPRNFNRVSAPDANSCGGCHNSPRSGGGGDIVANVFVLGQRFDHITFDPNGDTLPTKSGFNERGELSTLDEAANSRATLGMFGSGYIEMLARQMTTELRLIRDGIAPGGSAALTTKGISFGTLSRRADGSWNTAGVVGLPPSSAASNGGNPPTLIIKPFHQAGAVISLREFTNNAFNHHHGIQTTERFGKDSDPDGDDHQNEMTRADVTAVSVYQATLAVPGRRIARYRPLEEAVLRGEAAFAEVGCDTCHTPSLPLDNYGWFYTEPNPFNPSGNLRLGDAPTLKINLNSSTLPQPRLRAIDGVTQVPAYTDLKLHDITSGPNDPNRETLNMQFPAGSDGFFAGNSQFLTKKLWGAANEPPYYHHGKYTTLREAILAHAGEAQASTDAFNALSDYDQGSIVEFIKTLQVLPFGTQALVIDEKDRPREWPPSWAQ
ncbi:MAG: thiol oxidoreductase [Thermoanaerobaculia bacterium]|nr:thiol oxidoreductase [Thermoanaerobaculia bacterium]